MSFLELGKRHQPTPGRGAEISTIHGSVAGLPREIPIGDAVTNVWRTVQGRISTDLTRSLCEATVRELAADDTARGGFVEPLAVNWALKTFPLPQPTTQEGSNPPVRRKHVNPNEIFPGVSAERALRIGQTVVHFFHMYRSVKDVRAL